MPVGLNYVVNGKTIQVFDSEGIELENGQWIRNTGSYGTNKEGDPCSITMDLVNLCIEEAIEADQGNRIAQLQLGSQEAVALFLEGLITLKHFDHVYEERGFIILPEVRIPYIEIGGLWLIVDIRISKKKYGVKFIDDEGNVMKNPKVEVEEDMPDDFSDQGGGELIFANLGYDNLTAIDSSEDRLIEALEEGRFAQAA